MAVNLAPIGNGQQFFDNTGLPLAGGLLYTYQAGSSTPFNTYTTISGNVLNSNPIVLGTDGRPPQEIWLTYGYFYKFVLTDSTGTIIGTWDNIYGFIGTASATGATIPTGLISLWSGSIGSIPTGWYLCDGTNGTPDLRDRFVVGAGTTYAVTATGGSTDAVVVSHNHTATSVVTDPGHRHSVGSDTFNIGAEAGAALLRPAGVGTTSYTTTSTTGITVATTNTATGVSGVNANLPPYYALAYVMKG
jgi:hypothetical protein